MCIPKTDNADSEFSLMYNFFCLICEVDNIFSTFDELFSSHGDLDNAYFRDG